MAGGTIGNGDDEVISGINITPLVDVVLVLLIIFIVTASFILRSSIPIELPKAATSEESSAGLMVVGVSAAGELFINGREAKVDDIPAAVAEAKARVQEKGQKLNVFVSADIQAQYGRFAEVVDRLRLAGVTDISMDTRPVEVETPDSAPPAAAAPEAAAAPADEASPAAGAGAESEPGEAAP